MPPSLTLQCIEVKKISLFIIPAVVEEYYIYFLEDVDEKKNTTSVFIPQIKNNRAPAQRDAQRRQNKL